MTPLSLPLRVARATAIAACVPYLALKLAWIAGSDLGIPAGSGLLDHRGTMAVVNAVTVVMDTAVVVLALLLTRPWGQRVRAWLLVLPLWAATGLLAPIVTGFPLQLLVRALEGKGGGSGKPFLDAWVFGVVYTGFVVQGLALGVLAVAYARRRWGHLWRGRSGELPRGTGGQRFAAAAAALLALPIAGPRLLRERPADQYVLEALWVLLAAAAVVGALLLAFRPLPRLPVRLPLALVWVGSAALACWGAWLSLAALGAVEDLGGQPSGLLRLSYAVQMTVGLLVAAVGGSCCARRPAVRRPAP